MPDYTTGYRAMFEAGFVMCDVGYSVEADLPRDTLLVDRVEAFLIESKANDRSPRQRIDLSVPGWEPIAEAIADEIETIRRDEIFARCQGDYELHHKPKGR